MDDSLERKREGSETGPEPRGAAPDTSQVQLARPAQYRAAGIVQADQVEVNLGVAGAVVANEVSVDRGGALVNVGRQLSVSRGGSQWLVAEQAHLQQAGSGIMISGRVDASNSWVGVMIAGRVEGDPQPILDTRGAIGFGAALGAVVGIAMLLRRLLGGR